MARFFLWDRAVIIIFPLDLNTTKYFEEFQNEIEL